jgi:iron complex transport system substrate-binding protein
MRKRALFGAIAGLTLVVAACGDDDDDSAAADAPSDATSDATSTVTSPPATSRAPATSATPESDVPSAIISLSPTATEMLFAIGAGDQVIAVDDFSNYPDEAAAKMNGLNGFEPNVEAIGALEPDLVVTDGTNPELLAQLETLGIAHWEGPAAVTFDDMYAQIEQLGAATGHVPEAAEVVSQMQTDIAAVLGNLPDVAEPLTYYHELDPNGYWSVTSDTFIGLVYAEAGLVNIADEVGADTAYPQLSAEFIVAQDPDIVFLACTKYCGETPETVAARDGWGELSAVTNGNVIPMDDDIASRWGPRIVDYIEQVGAAVSQAAAVNAG